MRNQIEFESMLKLEKIILKLTSRLNATEDFQDVIEEILKYLAKETGVTSICIHVFNPDTQSLPLFTRSSSQCHFNLQDETYRCPFLMSQIVENIKAGKNYISSDLTELGNNERNYLKKKGIASILTLPIKKGRKISGMINFSNDHEHVWNQKDRQLFKTVTEIIANAWDRDYLFHVRLEAERKQTLVVQMAERSFQLEFFETLFAGIAHEINQPLHALTFAVDGMLYWKEKSYEISNEDVTKNLQLISEQANRIDDIITNMRTILKQTKGTEAIPYDINKEIINIMCFMKQRMSAHDIEVNLNLEDSLPIIERCPTQLIQVFSTLVTKAINALDKVDRKEKLISISTRYADGNFILEVMDNGLGIPEENLNQLFNTTFSTDVSCEGIDLGLVITNNIIVGIGGSISAHNREEGGTCFTVSIPVSIKNNPGII